MAEYIWLDTQKPSSLVSKLGLDYNMALGVVIVLLVMGKGSHSAIDAGVTVFGTTTPPNFKRQEGRGRLINVLQHVYD